MDLSAYQVSNFDDVFSGQEGLELYKAIQAGQITGRDTTNQALTFEPLKLESLDHTVKLLDFRMKDVKLWKNLPKDVVYNTVAEWVQQESYGRFTGGFYGEGETPDAQDSVFKRRAVNVKYLQVAGEVTFQAQAAKGIVDAMTKEVEAKTMWIIRAASYYLTRGDSNMVPKEFDGIYTQHQSIGATSANYYGSLDAWQDSVSVIDLRGASLKQTNIVDAATQMNSIYANVDVLYGSPSVIDGLNKDYIQRQRIIMGASGYTGVAGSNPKAVDTQFGEVATHSDIFMKTDGPKLLTDSATSAKAPTKPVAVSSALTGADTQSRFKTGEAHTGALGTVYYAVSAFNDYGESALTVLSNTVPITLTAGQSVDIKFTDGGGVFPATSYRIYRSKVTTATNATTGAVKFFPIFKVNTAQVAAGYDGGAATFVRDRNRILPDTESAITYEATEDVVSLREFMPISMQKLAITGPSNRFMCYYYLTPQLSMPTKLLRFLNVGPFTS